MVLAGSLRPSLEVHRSDHFVDVVHHLEWKLGRIKRQRWLCVKIVRCLGRQRLELGDEGVHLIWNKCEVSEFVFSPFPGSRILKRDLEASRDFRPIVFVRCWSSCCELPNHPIGPALGPVLDVWSLDETQHERHALHRVHHLFCVDVGQAVKVELVDECVREGAISIKIRRRVSPQLPITSASTGASWWSSATASWWSGTSTSSGWSGSAWWFPSWSTLPRAGFSEE